MDRFEQALIPLLAAALLGQMLSTAPVRWEAITLAFAPPDPAAVVIPPPDPAPDLSPDPLMAPAPRRVAAMELDPYNCFCGAN
ncbi:hypothetical protein [Azospirillum soli]|uniref:hypothetical protein n=1 Tax=Azospirillum soli TaxID=1304799 RepID=UPI001AE7C0D8|nr:hypothetical protein [Azospirillum soli]MBP2314783.1 hypothetical protein [Azospirillum soli]